jgi:hypothetical protein
MSDHGRPEGATRRRTEGTAIGAVVPSDRLVYTPDLIEYRERGVDGEKYRPIP